MFLAIFSYIEHLFQKIRPRKVFFMAVDGVAPRAKMNQQRSRRFRSAKDAHDARTKAEEEGEKLPKDDPFDSNCITPGTVFMTRLSQQLRYFINKKVSEDADWQGVKIILSGHEVPGEGEHKIMEYIRACKAEPGYNPNARECLYGLDADLIMLGLVSHEPHFCLLREEVTFGPVNKKKEKELESQNFYLMHLTLFREYLELEFQVLRNTLPFEYNIERIIDDFILMAFFVGNDFVPNLPGLNINEGALVFMFDTYKQALPHCDGYLNDRGVIHRKNLLLLLDHLEAYEKEQYNEEAENNDHTYGKDKRRGRRTPKKSAMNGNGNGNGNGSRSDQMLPVPPPKNLFSEVSESEDEEAALAWQRVSSKYSKAPHVEMTKEASEIEMKKRAEEKYQEWKQEYYRFKLEFKEDDQDAIRLLAENYVEGLQWVLHYYYQGVVSWGWFYKYHYAPKITDVRKGLLGTAGLEFDLGQPFHPFEQLMGVLPERSKKLVPPAYQELMTSESSPIIDFYPNNFALDLNGKKQDWEAIVKIPFIDQGRLLSAMETCESRLSADERARNTFGVPLQFIYDEDVDEIYPSSFPGLFPNVQSHCKMRAYVLPTGSEKAVFGGTNPGVLLGLESLAGFPTLHVLPFVGHLGYHGVNVFQRDSRNETIVISLDDKFEDCKTEDLAKEKIGQRVFVGEHSTSWFLVNFQDGLISKRQK